MSVAMGLCKPYALKPQSLIRSLLLLQTGSTTYYSTVTTCAPKRCKIMAFMAISMGSGLLFYIFLRRRCYCYAEP